MHIEIINSIPIEDIDSILNSYNKKFNDLELIGVGYSAQVFKYKNYAIKAYEEDDFCDGNILKNFQDNNLFPKLYFYNSIFMVTEYLKITNAYKYFEKNVDVNIDAYDIYKYCYEKNYAPYDIHDENIVVTNKDELKIIDVGNFFQINKNIISLEEIIKNNNLEYSELNNIINHVKRPPIAI